MNDAESSKKPLNDFELRKLGREELEKMDDATKELVSSIIYATIDVVNSMNPDNPFFFYEAVAWKVLKWEILGHLKNNEVWHVEDKCWKIVNSL